MIRLKDTGFPAINVPKLYFEPPVLGRIENRERFVMPMPLLNHQTWPIDPIRLHGSGIDVVKGKESQRFYLLGCLVHTGKQMHDPNY